MPTVTQIFDAGADTNGIFFGGEPQSGSMPLLPAFEDAVTIPAMPVVFKQNNFAGSAFGEESVFNQPEEGFVKYIDFEKLLSDLGKFKNTGMAYNYKDYESKSTIPIRSLIVLPQYFEKEVKEIEGTIEKMLPKQRSNVPYKDEETNQIVGFTGKLNIKKGFLPLDLQHNVFVFSLSVAKSELAFTDLFFYSEGSVADDASKVAIEISTPSYEDYLVFCKAYGRYPEPAAIDYIETKFTRALADAKGNAEDMAWLYNYLPRFILYKRDKQLLIDDLATILEGNVDENGINEELIILGILDQFITPKKQDQNLLLTELSKPREDGSNLFEKLYDKVDDWGGNPNFTTFIQTMYKAWIQSDHSNAGMYSYNGLPETLAYQNKKVFGFYDSNYRFGFAENKVEVLVKEQQGIDFRSGSWGRVALYELYQPIRLPEIGEDGEIKLPNIIIPAFYLKAFDDKAAWANFEKKVWLGIDIVTTLIPLGNLLKLRYLANLCQIEKIIRVAAGTIQVAVGVVNTMLNFVNNCNGEGFCGKLRTYLFWLDLATVSADAITRKMLTQTAEEALKEMPAGVRTSEKEIVQHLEDAAELGRKGAATGDITKSFFENARIVLKEERPLGKVFGQTKEYTCAANSLKMVLDDFEIVRSEQYLAAALETTKDGANILDIPKALENLYVEDIKTIARGGARDKNITASTLEKLLKDGKKKAVVSVATDDFGAHAIVVDKIESGRVFVRDPLPLYQGSCYSVAFEDFKRVFNDKFVTLKK